MQTKFTSINKLSGKIYRLQILCYGIYLQSLEDIKEGMSEIEIASFIRILFKQKGVEHFWYDIPIQILIGEKRFLDMKGNYPERSPSDNIYLKQGDTVNVDYTPIDSEGFWGDFSATCIYHPRTDYDFEKVEFLKLMRKIQRDGITRIKSTNTAKDFASWYLEKFKANDIALVDSRNNLGHSMHRGSKKYSDGSEKRIFIDANNTKILGEGIFAIEPGGFKNSGIDRTKILVGKFEDCIYIPSNGTPLILAPKKKVPLSVNI